ncbi:zinc finger BED domain-containing protein RICESLEEPER 2-like [Quercus lobata]|uniref:zinc finger BED domain-containing protein RICESLEEPER 2-like n=1 Tax=Quercus lobata TaxID=97700 RepID=UPI001246804B|nr:zinc finger BED domain-containing protein RICESLEEPER 2-like [Quercus lobata]
MSVTEGMDEFEQIVSSGSKISRSRTSEVWNDFEILPSYEDGHRKVKCRKCTNILTVDKENGTSNLRRHAKKCHQENDSVPCRPPLDQDMYCEKIAMAIIRHNYSISFAEHEVNRELHIFLNPDVKPICRNTAKSDVLKIYKRERENLKRALELVPGKICLTSDLWKSSTTDEYMVLTAHYIDANWELQMRVLCFSHTPPPRSGKILGERLFNILKEWGIEKKVFTITLDNASYNDTLVNSLKKNPSFRSSLPCSGEFFCVRCGAHILNLIVQEGLKIIEHVVHNIRESVKYVRDNDMRKLRFAECLQELPNLTSKKVRQDVSTRWNSTYLMIETALTFRDAFHNLSIVDGSFRTCPLDDEWDKAEKIAKFLKPFYDITTLFSGTQYPTTNLYFHGVWKIHLRILEEMEDEDVVISDMAKSMKEKFDKYWDCYSIVLSFAVILDPRYKLQFVEFSYKRLYGTNGTIMVMDLRDKLYSLFEGYLRATNYEAHNMVENASSSGANEKVRDADIAGFDTFESEIVGSINSKSQLDVYLEEARFDHNTHMDLDILEYWESHCGSFPELSLMARDIMSIPITTVA